MNPLEAIAVFFGVACVWLTIKQNILCWPAGLIQVILYIYIFFTVKLYSDVLLHIIYVGLQIYGWHHWLHGGPQHSKLPVTHLSLKAFAVWTGVGLFVAGFLGYGMARFTDASLPYPDSFTTIFSLCAQWLLARKRLQAWLFWIIVDIVAIFIYFHKNLYLTSGLYALFLGLATVGYFTWKKDIRIKI